MSTTPVVLQPCNSGAIHKRRLAKRKDIGVDNDGRLRVLRCLVWSKDIFERAYITTQILLESLLSRKGVDANSRDHYLADLCKHGRFPKPPTLRRHADSSWKLVEEAYNICDGSLLKLFQLFGKLASDSNLTAIRQKSAGDLRHIASSLPDISTTSTNKESAFSEILLDILSKSLPPTHNQPGLSEVSRVFSGLDREPPTRTSPTSIDPHLRPLMLVNALKQQAGQRTSKIEP
ncbi:MAG: hypothetical protein M1816_008246 [Peltula sp. TS41687]|nr:MAG: hypothetical protein M1816_008246 [Peltula sp. TS41687]